MTYIKTLIIPLTIITGLALLTACGGSATPADTNTDGDGDGDTLTVLCEMPENLFNADCITNDLGDDERANFCGTPTNRFNADCITNNLGGGGRMTFCEMPVNRFNTDCITNSLGGGGRATFCDIPDNLFNADCITNDLGGDDRTTFCEMPVNLFAQACIENDIGDNIRMTFCDMPVNLFVKACVDNKLGDDDGRTAFCDKPANLFVKACVENNIGDNVRETFCRMLVNRFVKGCVDNNLGDNDRTAFCDMPANLFVKGCGDNNLGDFDDRDNRCLMHGTTAPGHANCATHPELIKTCMADPFVEANAGCEDLDTIVSIKDVYCGIEVNAGKDPCEVSDNDWADSFGPGNAPPVEIKRTDGQRQNEFVDVASDGGVEARNETEGGTVFPGFLNLNGTNRDDGTTDKAAPNSVAYFSVTFHQDSKRYYYAGIDSRTDLGSPNFQNTGMATWNGQFQAFLGTDRLPVQDFELTINFEMKSVTSSLVREGSTNNYFHLKGGYDSKGVIDGMVNYTKLNGPIQADDRTTIMNDITPEGFLTGLIGKHGAVGAFISGTGDKDDITGGTDVAGGFAGGFAVAPDTACVTAGNCVANHAAWLTGFGEETPPATIMETIARVHTFGSFLNLATNARVISEAGFDAGTVRTGILTLDGTLTNGYRADGVHGVVYLGGQKTILDTNNQAFVAVLPTTNLGAVLVAQPTAAWPGHYYNGDVGTVQETTFMIDFDGKSIRATDTVASPAVTTTFALNFSDTGVVTGTVSDGTDTAAARGLIGTLGLVGVFVDATTRIRTKSAEKAVLYGGFVADNPDN